MRGEQSNRTRTEHGPRTATNKELKTKWTPNCGAAFSQPPSACPLGKTPAPSLPCCNTRSPCRTSRLLQTQTTSFVEKKNSTTKTRAYLCLPRSGFVPQGVPLVLCDANQCSDQLRCLLLGHFRSALPDRTRPLKINSIGDLHNSGRNALFPLILSDPIRRFLPPDTFMRRFSLSPSLSPRRQNEKTLIDDDMISCALCYRSKYSRALPFLRTFLENSIDSYAVWTRERETNNL